MANFVGLLIDVYCFIIFVSAILTWFPIDRDNDVVRFIDNLASIVLDPIRRFIYYRLNWNFPIDFSPIIAILGLQFLKYILIAIIRF